MVNSNSNPNPNCSLRCPHCAGPLSKDMETSEWTVAPFIRDSFSMIGSAVGGIASAFYGFNHVMPIVQKRIKGPMWLHFLIGAPPVIVFSSACAGLAGFGVATPFLKSFMQAGSRFGESTLRLGSILTDGQGRFGDILPAQAAGLLSSFTTARSDI